MKKPTFRIQEENSAYTIQMYNDKNHFLLESKEFTNYKSCQEFIDRLRVHMCFQTNFSRCKNDQDLFGFEIRTCWDDLIASSAWYISREKRERAMNIAFQCNKEAIFIHTPLHEKDDNTTKSIMNVA
jgi:hypothetical protein